MKLPLKKKKKRVSWQDWVMVLLIALIGVLVLNYWYSNIFRALEYKPTMDKIEANSPSVEMCREEIIIEVNNLTQTEYQIIWELGVDYYSKTTSIPFDYRVFLNAELGENKLVWYYTHEILHKKLYSGNERFVQFETFKVLYESGIEYFKRVALYEASQMKYGFKDYDCTYYVVQYLDGRDTNVLTIRK